jgi:hypothetical protein
MGRSQGRNKMANALLGSSNVNLKNSRNDLHIKQTLDYDDNVYKNSLMPEYITNGQIGISILWRGERGGLIFAMHPENDDPFASYSDIGDQEICKYLIDQVKQSENVLDWASDWGLSECLDVRFPGQRTHSMPKTDDYAVFVSSILNIDQKKFEELGASRFANNTASIFKNSPSLKEQIAELEQHISKPDLLQLLRDSTSPFLNPSLKVAFRKND